MKRSAQHFLVAAMTCSTFAGFVSGVRAGDALPAPAATDTTVAATRCEKAISNGLAFLKSQQQADAGWQLKQNEPPAMTALVLKAFVQDTHAADNKQVIDKALARLVTLGNPDGSVGDSLVTYNTAIVISAIALSNDPKYKSQLDKSVAYLRGLQWTDKVQGIDLTRKTDATSTNYGGWDYGNRKGRADLSNLQMALDALHDAGLKSDDPAYQAALKFVSRSQNLSETNDQTWAGDDGGFIYTPGEGGRSAAGATVGPNGQKRPRSYGAMTYAGLKSMMYAGLSKDDRRVQAAWGWIGRNWTLDEHPGMKEGDPASANAGMFYYYHTLARALHAYGEPIIVDSKGNKHDWRLELIDKLAGTQVNDGSWVGTQRWMENRPILSTALGVLALEEAEADLKEHPAKK